ncbi:MAG: glycosyltransferase [Actinomycetes bacterium]
MSTDGFRLRADLDYVLPLRWEDDSGLDELTSYLSRLSRHVRRVIIVDSSPAQLRAAHQTAWNGMVDHVLFTPAGTSNGKVDAVHRGLDRVSAPLVVVADDDVRWSREGLVNAVALLRDADLVSPQNYFEPAPWHAQWDTGRTLFNRSFGHDYPGTFVLRRSAFDETGGYDADVLFENLELLRTFEASRLRVLHAPELMVRRLPSSTSKFRAQRVRQAYDDFAQPIRAGGFLAIVPAFLALGMSQPLVATAVAPLSAVLLVLLAERGRRLRDGHRTWPWWYTLWTPIWTIERALCIWVAVAWWLSGGVPYAGARLKVAAHSKRALERRQLTTPQKLTHA